MSDEMTATTDETIDEMNDVSLGKMKRMHDVQVNAIIEATGVIALTDESKRASASSPPCAARRRARL